MIMLTNVPLLSIPLFTMIKIEQEVVEVTLQISEVKLRSMDGCATIVVEKVIEMILVRKNGLPDNLKKKLGKSSTSVATVDDQIILMLILLCMLNLYINHHMACYDLNASSTYI